MLFGYPIEATHENWFHECLVEILNTIHANPKVQPRWPDIIPPACQDKLKSRTSVHNRLIAYQKSIENLSSIELQQISDALIQQNNISGLLSGTCSCDTLENLPQNIHQSVKELFDTCFKLLTDLGIRDIQYKIIYDSTLHICPFCGCESFDAPGAPREALDHYLAESIYTFAAINLQNLVPMGHKCNSKYKLAKNVLFAEDGSRRTSFFPYNNGSSVQISLEKSEPFEGISGLYPLPAWNIEFSPIRDEVETWNSVFNIADRYKRDILDADFMSWLREFAAWCKSNIRNLVSEQELIDALDRYAVYMQEMGFRDRAFLKAAVFRMLHHHCMNGHERLMTLLAGVVNGGMA
jgi:hypothetical protein